MKSKHTVILSDTSHPFTTYVDDAPETVKWEKSWQNDPNHNNPDEEDNSYRTLTTPEFEAIRAFQSNWGYVGNHDISDDLVDMLADMNTPANTLIERIMRKWDLTGPDYSGIRTDLQNLFIVRLNAVVPFFTSDEVKALESLEGEKSDMWTEKPLTLAEYNKAGKSPATLRKELFQEESDKRVERFFIQQSGWVWVVYHITDIPEALDDYTKKFLFGSKDGMSTYLTTSLHMTERKAWEHIESVLSDIVGYDPETLTHVIELDKM